MFQKWTPDMIKWISQQMIDFVFYFGMKYFLEDSLEYHDVVVQSVFIFGKVSMTFEEEHIENIEIFLVIRLWVLYLIWTCPIGTKDKVIKQDLNDLLEAYDLRHEEEDRFLV